jgi:hypothetical protein
VLLKRKKLSPHNYCMIHCYEVVKVGLKHIGFVLLFGMVLGFELRALSRLLGSCLTDLQSLALMLPFVLSQVMLLFKFLSLTSKWM